MAQFKPPEKFDFSNGRWTEWKNAFTAFRMITELDKKSAELQVATLKYCMGSEIESILRTMNLTEDEAKSYETIVNKLDAYFKPRKNIIRLRRIFHKRLQLEHENVETYLRELYEAAEDCDFTDKKERIRDQFISGIYDDELAEKLELMYLSKGDNQAFSLKKVTEYARTYVDVKNNRRNNMNLSRTSVDRIQNKTNADNQASKCARCGFEQHTLASKCPALGKTCNYCKKVNHFASVCRTKHHARSDKTLNEVTQKGDDYTEECSSEECSSVSYLGMCKEEQDSNNATNWEAKIKVNDSRKKIIFKIDTGADVCVMNSKDYQKITKSCTLMKSDRKLVGASGPIKIKGMFPTTLSCKGKEYKCNMYVLEDENTTTNLLSRDASVYFELVKFVGNAWDDSSIYGFGKWDTTPVKLHLKEDSQPYAVMTSRKVPIPLMKPVKQALDEMEANGVIEKVTHPTEWTSPMIPIQKPSGKVRICVDLRKLNLCLKRETYPLPTFEEISAKFYGAKWFSKLDAASGFYQIPIEQNSSDLTAFITPYGRYKFLRLPMGINIAPEIYQRKMDELLAGMKGVMCYMDDVLIVGQTENEHDENLRAVLSKIMSSGLKLNKEKCELKKQSIRFLGHVISNKGIQVDPEKVEAIVNLEEPQNVAELRKFLGMVNFLTKFIPRAQDVLHPLNELLQSDAAWVWNSPQEVSFKEIKKLLTTSPILTFYDPQAETILSVDASSYGLGGVLLQRQNGILRLVAYCSRSLTSNEKTWAQIEKELLAAVYGSEKFHIFLCGLKYTIQTDHKPLVPIINKKDLVDAPLRCQSLLMRLATYTAEAIYVPGKYLVVADALSRLHNIETDKNCYSKIDEEVQSYVNLIYDDLPATNKQLERIKSFQCRDGTIQDLKEYTVEGWPETEKSELREYAAARGNFSIINGLLMYANRIVVPSELRREMLSRIHDTGHLSLYKCRERTKASIWWPKLPTDLKDYVDRCHFCQINRRQQKAEPLQTTPLPKRPWSKIGIDLCTYKGKNYLIIVAYFSRWIEMPRATDTTSKGIINLLKSQFARWGLVDEIRSDGGPQFNSAEFRYFCKNNDIYHSMSDPYHAQGNGAAERAVQTAKRILKQENISTALLAYRATPIDVTGYSPAQLMLGKNLKTELPVSDEQLKPEWPDFEHVLRNHNDAKKKSAENFNRAHGARPLPPLHVGQDVRVRNNLNKSSSEKTTVDGP